MNYNMDVLSIIIKQAWTVYSAVSEFIIEYSSALYRSKITSMFDDCL